MGPFVGEKKDFFFFSYPLISTPSFASASRCDHGTARTTTRVIDMVVASMSTTTFRLRVSRGGGVSDRSTYRTTGRVAAKRRLVARRVAGPRSDPCCRPCLLACKATGGDGGSGDDDHGESGGEVSRNTSDAETPSTAPKQPLLARFTNPVVNDPGLPLADALISGAIAPTVLSTLALSLPISNPMWLKPTTLFGLIPAWRGLPYLVPTLAHGAALALCWTLGALGAELYREENYGKNGEEAAVLQAQKAGAFASGLIILATQLQIFFVTLAYDDTLESDLPSESAQVVRVVLDADQRITARGALRQFVAPPPDVVVVDVVNPENLGCDPYAAAVLGETSLDIGVEALALLSWRRLRAQLYTQIGD